MFFSPAVGGVSRTEVCCGISQRQSLSTIIGLRTLTIFIAKTKSYIGLRGAQIMGFLLMFGCKAMRYVFVGIWSITLEVAILSVFVSVERNVQPG